MSTNEPQPKTTRGRIVEFKCKCGRRFMDARLEGHSVVRLRCPRCSAMIVITAETYSVRVTEDKQPTAS